MGLISRVSSRTYRYFPRWEIIMFLRLETAVFLSTLFLKAHGLYFHLYRNERKCFIEEMPEDTIFHGIYDVKISEVGNPHKFVETAAGFGMYVDVTNEDCRSVLSRSYGANGKFTFTSDIPGEYTICMGSNATSAFNMLKDTRNRLRVNFKIKVGEHTQNYHEIAKKNQLTEMETHLRKMIEQIGGIAREQNFQRFREERFRRQSQDVNSKLWKWGLVQVCVLVSVGLYQMRNLKKFFEAKKLV